jgi:hypothetical protein
VGSLILVGGFDDALKLLGALGPAEGRHLCGR